MIKKSLYKTICWVCLVCVLVLCTPAHAQWTEPVRLSDFSLRNPRAIAVDDTLHIVAASGTDIYYLRSNNNGLTWTEPAIPVPDSFYGSQMPDIDYSNGLLHLVCKIYILGDPTRPFHFSSSDGGRTWSAPHQIHDYCWKYPRLTGKGDTLVVSFITEDDLLASVSFDNGETWNEPSQVDYRSVINNTPYIMYSNGRIHLVYQMGVNEDTTGIEIYHRYSDDLGVTWSDRFGLSTLEHWQEGKHGQKPSAYADSDGNIMALWMDYKYGSACGISGDILGRISCDNGDTWLPETRLTDTQTGRKASCLVLDDKLYAVWSDYFIFYCEHTKIMYAESSNWGDSWSVPEVISGPADRDDKAPVLIYNINNRDTIFHCVMAVYDPPDGSGLHYFRSQEFTGIDIQDNEIVPRDILLNAHPNPFNSSTVISYSNLKGGDIEIFNLRGQKVKSLDLGKRKEGKVIWDATDELGNKVSSGIYFVKASVSDKTDAVKLVYLR